MISNYNNNNNNDNILFIIDNDDDDNDDNGKTGLNGSLWRKEIIRQSASQGQVNFQHRDLHKPTQTK